MEYIILIQKISDFEKNINMELNLINTFPMDTLLKFIFDNKTDYWLTLALKYFENIDTLNQNKLKPNIINLINNGELSQKNKHKIQKILSLMSNNSSNLSTVY